MKFVAAAVATTAAFREDNDGSDFVCRLKLAYMLFAEMYFLNEIFRKPTKISLKWKRDNNRPPTVQLFSFRFLLSPWNILFQLGG